MSKVRHKSVKFSAAEMAEDAPADTDFSKMRYVGRGRTAMEISRQISRARGEKRRQMIESLPYCSDVQKSSAIRLAPDVAAVFKDSVSVNKALRAIIEAMPKAEPKKYRKTA